MLEIIQLCHYWLEIRDIQIILMFDPTNILSIPVAFLSSIYNILVSSCIETVQLSSCHHAAYFRTSDFAYLGRLSIHFSHTYKDYWR